MAKSKKTREELKADLQSAKEEHKAARSEQRAFEKENSLEKGSDHSSHEKLGKKWAKLNEITKKKEKKVEEAEVALKEAKKEKIIRPTKYTYPDDVKTPQEKKKYRAKMRAASKKKDKGDEKASKKNKKQKKEKKEKPAPSED